MICWSSPPPVQELRLYTRSALGPSPSAARLEASDIAVDQRLDLRSEIVISTELDQKYVKGAWTEPVKPLDGALGSRIGKGLAFEPSDARCCTSP